MSALETRADNLKAQFGDVISEPVEFRGEITVNVRDAERIAECALSSRRNWALIIWWISRAWTITARTRATRSSIILYGYGHRCHLRLEDRM